MESHLLQTERNGYLRTLTRPVGLPCWDTFCVTGFANDLMPSSSVDVRTRKRESELQEGRLVGRLAGA